MSGISAIYILDKKGRVLIFRCYREDVTPNCHDYFNKKILQFDQYNLKPVMIHKEGIIFYYIRHNDLLFFAASKNDSNALMIFAFLYTLVDVLTKYFNEVREESIRDNFVIVYELLDQMMDNGYPQTTQYKLLKQFIKTQSYELNILQNKNKKIQQQIQNGIQISCAVSWRTDNIFYKKNQFYLDVTEHVSMTIGNSQNILKSQVMGNVVAFSKLSGMPLLRLGLNDKSYYDSQGRTSKSKAVEFGDIKFHQCVRLQKFENERIVNFVPPDGQFQLFSYRIDLHVKPLFIADIIVQQNSSTKVLIILLDEIFCKGQKHNAKDVEIFIPVPQDTQTPVSKTSNGKCIYVPEKLAVCWKVASFPGKKQYFLDIDMNLPSVPSPNRNRFKKYPIQINFQIPYYTVSGFQIRYLKIQQKKSGYKALQWVKYLTKNGDFNIRVHK